MEAYKNKNRIKTKEIERKSPKKADNKELTQALLSEELNPEINEDQTDDFDLNPEKMPALSTMKSNLKLLNKKLATTVIPNFEIIQQFDKLKIWIDLKKYGREIDFKFNLENSNLLESDTPEKGETYLEWCDRKNIEPSEDDIESEKPSIEKDDDEEGEEGDEDEEEIKEAEKEFWGNHRNSNKKYKYPNCRIDFRKRPIGLLNVCIKNDILSIYLTGKFTWNSGKIDYITKYNIREILGRICNLVGIKFNIEKFISLAGVYLADVCIDLSIENMDRYINALSSLFPLSSNKCRIMKFGSHGLKLKSNAKNAGSSLTCYKKLQEILNSVNKSKRLAMELQDVLENQDNLKDKFRIEVQMYRLRDIRALLEIPQKEPGIIKLIDILNSQAKPILTRFEKFEATEEKLKEKVELYVEDAEKPRIEKWTSKQLLKNFAAKYYALLIIENGYNIQRTKSCIITECGMYSEPLVQELIREIKDNLWNFLMYTKPKAIKLVIELLDKIHTYYGRRAA